GVAVEGFNGGGAGGVAEDGEEDGRGVAGEDGFLAVEELIAEDLGGAFGEVEGGVGGFGFGFGGFAGGGDAEELLEAGEVGVGAAFEFGLGKGFVGAVEHAL